MKNQAFTLIELLIVVAIIGILAAIAVPNFLGAQVRAKIAKAQADMKSLSTAIESYRIDSNTYPPDGDDAETFSALDFNTETRLGVLTSPISYMSSLPSDPFHMSYVEFPEGSGIDLLFQGNAPHTYIYNTFGSFQGGQNQPPNNGQPDNYGLSSIGPNQVFNAFIGFPIQYDPSNGLNSAGDITIYGGARTPLSP